MIYHSNIKQISIVSIFIIFNLLFYGCSFKSYLSKDSKESYGYGVVSTTYDTINNEIYKKEVISYKNGTEEHELYLNEILIKSYIIENGDTINRIKNGIKEGHWQTYIPKNSLFEVFYYKNNIAQYSYCVYFGKPIELDLYTERLTLNTNDTISVGINDSTSVEFLHIKTPTHNIKYLEMSNSRKITRIIYKFGVTNEIIELEFYLNQKLASKSIFVNNMFKPILIYDKKGNIVFSDKVNEKTEFHYSNKRLKPYFKNHDRIIHKEYKFWYMACDYRKPMDIFGSKKNK